MRCLQNQSSYCRELLLEGKVVPASSVQLAEAFLTASDLGDESWREKCLRLAQELIPINPCRHLVIMAERFATANTRSDGHSTAQMTIDSLVDSQKANARFGKNLLAVARVDTPGQATGRLFHSIQQYLQGGCNGVKRSKTMNELGQDGALRALSSLNSDLRCV